MLEARTNNIPIVAIFGQRLTEAFKDIDVSLSRAQIEQMAHFLAHSMGSESRDFHHPEHALDVSKGLSGVFLLGSLFHNVVYVQVDSSWERWLGDLVPDIALTRDHVINLEKIISTSEDQDIYLCALLCGVSKETALTPALGLNEFLASIVFLKKMKSILPVKTLLQGIAAIACSIPYRKDPKNPDPPMKRLGDRLKSTAKRIKHEFNEIEIAETTSACKKIVQNDLSYFTEENASTFLSAMWRIMYEKNASLRNSYFSISAFRKAVHATYDTMMTLDGRDMFWAEAGNAEDDQLARRADRNLMIGRHYLNAQLVSIALLEAVALSTGGDCAWELFYGSKKRSREDNPISLDEMLLPSDVSLDEAKGTAEVYALLKDGRRLRSRFDRKTNTLAAYLFGSLRSKEFARILESSQQFFKRQIKADEFLLLFSRRVVETVLISLTRTATTRIEELEGLKKAIAQKKAA